MSTAHLAEWIRWTGVVVAVAGALIATPDGVGVGWSYGRRGARRMRVLLAPFLPFLRQSANVMGTTARATAAAADTLSVVRRRDWEPDASDSQKTEILHQQIALLLEEFDNFRGQVTRQFTAARQDLRQAEVRLSAAHGDLTEELKAKEKRTAQVDARGLWPIGFGILLTGIPAELAHFPWLGIAVTAAAVVLTVWLALAGISARHAATN